MSFHYRGLSSTDYHAKVHMQENKEKAFSEYASLTLMSWIWYVKNMARREELED